MVKPLPWSSAGRVIALCLALITSRPATAFSPQGHEEIEGEAYSLIPPEDLKLLIDRHAIRSYINGQPVRGSGGPDMAVERQLDTEQQCYHFMAPNSAVPRKDDAARLLLRKAYPECLKLMRMLYDELLENPLGARQAGRGLYVLQHIVGDSFSREHTTRDTSDRIERLKAWLLLNPGRLSTSQLEAEPSRNGELSVLLYFHTDQTSPSADSEWGECAFSDEKQVCSLSPRGARTAVAVADLLKTVAQALRAPEARDTLWSQWIRAHFDNSVCPLTANGQFECPANTTAPEIQQLNLTDKLDDWDADVFPSRMLGIGYGFGFPRHQLLGTWRHFTLPWEARGIMTRLLWGYRIAGALDNASGTAWVEPQLGVPFSARSRLFLGLGGAGGSIIWDKTSTQADQTLNFRLPVASLAFERSLSNRLAARLGASLMYQTGKEGWIGLVSLELGWTFRVRRVILPPPSKEEVAAGGEH
ncbi:hypothetical protein OWM54_14425 [Myxococcus sp. MISCRS1]|uniref:hypothetical protein n=1 Tax=Myxococcus sp. MISCRS1 TaxID=2996786 RepID=UPI0022709F02|nr:hypothetical protein [Myxococcus sp. MISCRS1]MCY0998327.1 hypothetical protein [Myxococcus sp. MISCRS1]